jgi:hypothetical protein
MRKGLVWWLDGVGACCFWGRLKAMCVCRQRERRLSFLCVSENRLIKNDTTHAGVCMGGAWVAEQMDGKGLPTKNHTEQKKGGARQGHRFPNKGEGDDLYKMIQRTLKKN